MFCDCSNNDLEPICGINGLTYFSPCHAGCTQFNTNKLAPAERIMVRIFIPRRSPTKSEGYSFGGGRPSVHSVRPSGTISQYLLVRFNSFLVQMISTMDFRYPISLVNIDPKTLDYCPCLSIGNYKAKLLLALLCDDLHISSKLLYLRTYATKCFPYSNIFNTLHTDCFRHGLSMYEIKRICHRAYFFRISY